MKKPKILLLGHGGHGKDEVALMFNRMFGVTFTSSSMAAAKIFLFDLLKDEYGYKTLEECYSDRNSTPEMRTIWYNHICEYNKDDKARLAKEILETSDMYVGMRDSEEIDECDRQSLFDLKIWVDGYHRLGTKEASTSFKIDESYADIILDNNGTKQHTIQRVFRLGMLIFSENDLV